MSAKRDALLVAMAVGLSWSLVGCGPVPAQAPRAVAPRSGQGVLTAAEMSVYPDAARAIHSLRRQWLSGRSANQIHRPSVFVDGVLTSGTDVLAGLRTERVKEIRFLQAWEAGARYGPGHLAGAIMVTTRR